MLLSSLSAWVRFLFPARDEFARVGDSRVGVPEREPTGVMFNLKNETKMKINKQFFI